MGLLGDNLARGKSRTKAMRHPAAESGDGNPNHTSTLDKEEGNVLMSLIAQRTSIHLFVSGSRLIKGNFSANPGWTSRRSLYRLLSWSLEVCWSGSQISFRILNSYLGE